MDQKVFSVTVVVVVGVGRGLMAPILGSAGCYVRGTCGTCKRMTAHWLQRANKTPIMSRNRNLYLPGSFLFAPGCLYPLSSTLFAPYFVSECKL